MPNRSGGRSTGWRRTTGWAGSRPSRSRRSGWCARRSGRSSPTGHTGPRRSRESSSRRNRDTAGRCRRALGRHRCWTRCGPWRRPGSTTVLRRPSCGCALRSPAISTVSPAASNASSLLWTSFSWVWLTGWPSMTVVSGVMWLVQKRRCVSDANGAHSSRRPSELAVRGEDEPVRGPQRCPAEDRDAERLAAAVPGAVRLEPREVGGVLGPARGSQARHHRTVLPLAHLVERHQVGRTILHGAADGGHQRRRSWSPVHGPAGHVPRPHGVRGGHGRPCRPRQPDGGGHHRDETHQARRAALPRRGVTA